MTDPDNGTSESARRKSLEDLDKRLKTARGQSPDSAHGGKSRASGSNSGVAVAWRISIELAVAIGVCAAIGIGLDTWLGTKPWLLVVFIVLGFAAGVRNVYRIAQKVAAEMEEEEKSSDRGA